MAKGSQTFAVSLSLLTKNFQKGVKTVQASLNNLRMQFRNFAATLGAGLGINQIASTLVDSARRLDKAQAVLKNVSGGVAAYGENQKFVMDLSKKYNQELVTLTANYAKYHATANQANIPLEEQKYIYESLTRASAYFNLSADETNGVMLAITQMMSKGRVSSEELRRQLGERLPGAMGLMAKAMGVTNEQLEIMLKRGELLAVDALPKFAKELNNVTKNLDVDNIEGASNKLKNAITNLSVKMNIGGMYKKIINGVGNGIQYVADNLNDVAYNISAVFGALLMKSGISKVTSTWTSFFDNIQKQLDKSKAMIKVYQAELNDFLKEKKINLVDSSGVIKSPKMLLAEGVSEEDVKKISKLIGDGAFETKKMNDLQDKLNHKWKAFGGSVGKTIKKLAGGVAIQGIYMAIAAAISLIVTRIVKWASEQKRIRNLVKDTAAEIDKMANKVSEQETSLDINRAVAIDKKAPESDRIQAINRLNEMLGLEKEELLTIKSTEDEINRAVNTRIQLLREEQRYQATLAKLTELQNREKELTNQKTEKQGLLEETEQMMKTNGYDANLNQQYKTLTKDIKTIDKELAQLAIAINEKTEEIKPLEFTSEDRKKTLEKASISNTGTGDVDNRTDVQKEFDKIQQEYNSNLRALNEQRKQELITEKEHQKAVGELNVKTAESILALDDIDENTNAFAKSVLDAAKAFSEVSKKEDKVKEALDNYYEETNKLYNQYNNGVLTQEELDEGLLKLLEEVVRTTASLGDLSGSAELLAKELANKKKYNANKEVSDLLDEEMPELGGRKTAMDYKKSGSEIQGEWAEVYREYESGLQSLIEKIEEIQKLEPTARNADILEELNKQLQTATANAETFEQAMTLSEISEDVTNLKNELNEGIYDNFANIANAAERLTSAIKNVMETMEDPDATAWEKILDIFNAITQVTDTIFQSVQLISQLSQVFDKLKKAEAAYHAVQAVGTAQTVAAAATTVTAKQAEATASGTAEAAKLPFPANLVAIAGMVAMIAGIFAALPKFAHGGIVKGSPFGDKNLIRANGGEMILNKQQQSTLFGMLNGSNSGMFRKGNVEFKIKGSELVGVLNNYNNKLRG